MALSLSLSGGGILHGAFATGGPFVVLYSAQKLTDKGEFRTTMCLLWATLNAGLTYQFYASELLTRQIGYDILLLLPALVLGIVVGEMVHKRINDLMFKKIVFSTLLLTWYCDDFCVDEKEKI